jgi:hypothetical protein
MELEDNASHQQTNQGKENPNPPQPPDLNTQINEGLDTLITLINQLRGTREPRIESLETSLDIIVRFIASAQGKLTSISKCREKMFEYYNTGLDRKQVGDLGISKK